MVRGHLQGVAGEQGLLAGDPGHGLGGERQRIERGAGQGEGWRLAAGEAGDLAQEFTQGRVLAAQDVALADAPLGVGQQVACGDIVHVHEIEAGVDEGGDASGGGLDDHLAGGGGPHVAGANGRGGVDDDGGQAALGHQPLDHPLGGDLALLVGADGLAVVQGGGLVDDGVGVAGAQGGDRGGIDNPPHARGQGGLHHGAGPGDVGADDLGGVRRPQAVVGGDVKQVVDALHGPGQGVGIGQVAQGDFAARALEIAFGAGRTGEDAQGQAAAAQRAQHRAAHEPGRAGDQHPMAGGQRVGGAGRFAVWALGHGALISRRSRSVACGHP